MSDDLKDIREILEDIKALLLLSNSSAIEQAKKNILKDGSEEHKIYNLCDGKTTEEIIAATGKTPGSVRGTISTLRQKGLIKTVEREGKKVHEQRF